MGAGSGEGEWEVPYVLRLFYLGRPGSWRWPGDFRFASGPFTDNGKLFLSSEVNVPNSIDPFYMEENGKKYVFWGSFSNAPTQGTYGVELSPDGKSIPDLSKKFKVAAGDFEAVMIQKKGDYYYFLGSKGSCCEGAKSKYNVRIGRSKTIFGPFLDKDGKDLKERGTGSVLIQPNAKYAGPGHNSRWITDDSGTDWLLYHAIDRNNPNVSTGANRTGFNARQNSMEKRLARNFKCGTEHRKYFRTTF
jgi:arabinan endo-1,5-alpha-L-arabinosidase